MNKEPPPPMVLVPPLFNFPPLAARTRFPLVYCAFSFLLLVCCFNNALSFVVYETSFCFLLLVWLLFFALLILVSLRWCRMLESSYNLLFGKLALKCLFEDYFEEARHFTTRIMLKPIDDPHVDLIATVSIKIIVIFLSLSLSSLVSLWFDFYEAVSLFP